MNELIEFIEKNQSLFFSGPLLWVLLRIVASIVYRRSREKEILTFKSKNALFYEGWASGHSNRSIFTKLGGAHNCLGLAVISDALIVQPRFPFNLMFLPEIYDLEHRIPSMNIRSIKVKRSFFSKTVEIQFTGSDGGTRSIKLYLRKLDDFLAAHGKVSDVVADKIGR